MPAINIFSKPGVLFTEWYKVYYIMLIIIVCCQALRIYNNDSI